MSQDKSQTTIYRELGGLTDLIILSDAATTPGMVMVARAGTDWQQRPELRWQAWPDLLVPTPSHPDTTVPPR